MQELRMEDFQGARTLETLYIKQNPDLTELSADTFIHAKNLKYINLKENGLVVIHEKAFDGLRKLTEIYLTKNKLFMIHSKTFGNLNSSFSRNWTSKFFKIIENRFYPF
jgi:hypothetical protein